MDQYMLSLCLLLTYLNLAGALFKFHYVEEKLIISELHPSIWLDPADKILLVSWNGSNLVYVIKSNQ